LGDLFTKGLSRIIFTRLRKKLMGWWFMFALSRGSIAVRAIRLNLLV
jgi:hypothetical protein